MKDPFVQEIRNYRMEHTRQFHSNLHLICDDLRKFDSLLANAWSRLNRARFSQQEGPGDSQVIAPDPDVRQKLAPDIANP